MYLAPPRWYMVDRPSPTQTAGFNQTAQLVANYAQEVVLAITRDKHGKRLDVPYCVLLSAATDEDIEVSDMMIYPQPRGEM